MKILMITYVNLVNTLVNTVHLNLYVLSVSNKNLKLKKVENQLLVVNVVIITMMIIKLVRVINKL